MFKDYDVMTVGEMSGGLKFYEAMKCVAKERKELSMVFHFGHLRIVRDSHLYIENRGITAQLTSCQDEGPNDKWEVRKWKC